MLWMLLLLYSAVYFVGQLFAWVVNHIFLKPLLSYRASGLIAVGLTAVLTVVGFLWATHDRPSPTDGMTMMIHLLLPAAIVIGVVGYRAGREAHRAKEKKKSTIVD